MALYRLKGEGVIHKRVTPICRERPIEDIKNETVEELWRKYKDALNDESTKDADFHFLLTVDRK